MHKLTKILIVLALVLQIALGFGVYKVLQKPKQVTTKPQEVAQTAPEFVLDPYIAQLADEAGINKDDLVKLKTTIQSNNVCGGVDTLGCYHNMIIIIDTVKTRDRYKQRVTLAHEYLHYIWTKADQESLKPHLLRVYQQNKSYFDARFISYYNKGMKVGDYQFYNELHSFVGTEVSDRKLPTELLIHYSKYTNRSSLPSYI